jgi:hypothetical protein
MGADVSVELGSTGPTQISLGSTGVRTLIGAASGAVVFPTNFYGKSSGPTVGLFYGGFTMNMYQNSLTRLNACGALLGLEAQIGGSKTQLAGAPVGTSALYYGGIDSIGKSVSVTLFNKCGFLVGTGSAASSLARHSLAGAKVGSNGLFYGGVGSYANSVQNTVTRINACGALGGFCTTVGTARSGLAGAPVGCNGLFFGGNTSCNANLATRINACGALVGLMEYAQGSKHYCGPGGAKVGSNGLFFSGAYLPAQGIYAINNKVTRITACGFLFGSETTAGCGRIWMSGHQVGSNGLFFGGRANTNNPSNRVTRINACGTLVGSETTVGYAREATGSAGL